MATRVYVIDAGRTFYYLQWVDPHTGKRHTRSSKAKTKRDAERAAIALEAKLAGELNHMVADWDAFADDYATQHLATLAEKSELKATGVVEGFGRVMQPASAASVTTQMLTAYASHLRSSGATEATIASHFKTLRAALAWGKSHGYLEAVPQIPKVQRSLTGRKMKGRPLSVAEFARMLRAVRDVIPAPHSRSWRRLLRGLWLSGLRLGEAIGVTWDDASGNMIDMTGQFPMLRVVAGREKGFRDRLLPLTPDFAEWLLRTPPDQRTGNVFRPIGKNGKPVAGEFYVSRVISQIGRAAGIVVDARSGKFASAHDLRRSFGSRWARRVSPQVLRELMRHASVQTTMSFYVELEAVETASDLWKSWSTQLFTQH